MTNITVIGGGYVGLSLSVMISQKHKVTILDSDTERVNDINNRHSYLKDDHLKKALKSKKLNIQATTNKKKAIESADVIFCCLPTDFDTKINSFKTKLIEEYASYCLRLNKSALFVIKSTVPIGFTNQLIEKISHNILFVPEFLREGTAYMDSCFPDRIVIGYSDRLLDSDLTLINKILISCTKNNPKVIKTGASEAESIKLFSNTYLAARVAFFNEVDSFSLAKNLNTEDIIRGISSDKRIGDHYNNPSFGYGGYCLPKDVKQSDASFKQIPQSIFKAIISSNSKRATHLANYLKSKNVSRVGFYRLNMKMDSDNIRESSTITLLNRLSNSKFNLVIYEPLIHSKTFQNTKVEKDLDKFVRNSDIIVANRMDKISLKFKDKVFTRDLFSKDT